MIYGDFGLQLFSSYDVLLTATSKLVHYGEESKYVKRNGYPTGVFFYIKDNEVCQEKDDAYFVTNVVPLSNIPIYYGHAHNHPLSEDVIDNENSEKQSNVYIYCYFEEYKFRFFVRFAYKGELYDEELSEKTVSLLKYKWFTTQNLTFEMMEELGEEIHKQVANTNAYRIINNLKIIYSEREYSIRDNDYTSLIERWLIDTEDFYILYKLLRIVDKLYPRPSNDYVRYMYGPGADGQYTIFNKSHAFVVARYNFLKGLIKKYETGDDIKDLIKYYLLMYGLHNWVYSDRLASKFEFRKPDMERFEEEKTKSIISEFISSYEVGRHIAGLYYVLLEATKVPDEVMRDVTAGYKKWLVEEIEKSGLSHLCIYWQSKEICEEFNKRSNARFNFIFDFSLLDKVQDAD